MTQCFTASVDLQDPVPRIPIPCERTYQELWLGLARRAWRVVVLVPADPGGSADAVARALAAVGDRLSDLPVTAVTVGSLEYESALALADLQRRTPGRDPPPSWRAPRVEAAAATAGVEPDGAAAARPRGGAALAIPTAARVLVAIPAVVSEPLGLAVAHGADAVVVCVERGKARLADVRRTVELVGRDRIAGCFLLG
jgi:hypothetical protein